MTSAGATLRGSAAVKEVSELLADLRAIDAYAEAIDQVNTAGNFELFVCGVNINATGEEIKHLIHRRRERVTNLLENKGIHIRPDAVDAHV